MIVGNFVLNGRLTLKKNKTMIETKKIGKTEDYVYDISLDGTVVNGFGMNILSNTDGFNFQMPNSFRYTEEHPYISNGGGRNSIKGKKYTGVEADVAEFEDMFMCHSFNGGINKNGLGIDEFVPSSINFARKTYSDLLDNGKVKLVGNTIKSKKMPLYIEKFMSKAIGLLLNNKGKEFLEEYYNYIEKIYNLQIPLKDIASVGKIKTSINEYKENCKQTTAAGSKKARQAWYELAIKHNLKVDMGDSIYYINTGDKKNSSDVQRVTKYYEKDNNGELADKTREFEKEYSVYSKEKKLKSAPVQLLKKDEFIKDRHPSVIENDEIVFNCVLLTNDIVEDEDEHFCNENFEYNVAKYIDQFNKRIRPLLVCFSKTIRTYVNEKGKEVDNILITNPKDRKTFTEEESKLISGEPYNECDQDTYEQLMTMEDKEIKFWLSVNKTPPYVNECGLDWDNIVKNYNEKQERLKSEDIQGEIKYFNNIIDSLTKTDVNNFCEDGIIPDKIMRFCDEDIKAHTFVSKKWAVPIGSFFDIIDKDFSIEKHEE